MKKKISILLVVMTLCFVCLSFTAKVKASTLITDGYHGGTISDNQDGGIFTSSALSHANMVQVNIDSTLDSTQDKYLNMKGYVENIYRIKFFYKRLNDASSGQQAESRVFDTKASGGLVTLQDDNTFVWHYELPQEFFTEELDWVAFQVYMDSSDGGTGKLQLLGMAFDADGTYSSFYEGEESLIGDAWTKTEGIALSSLEKDGIGKASYALAQSSSIDDLTTGDYFTIPVNKYSLASIDSLFVSLKYKAVDISYIGLHLNYNKEGSTESVFVAQILDKGWNVKETSYEAVGIRIATAAVFSYLDKEATEITGISLKVQSEGEASLEMMGAEITVDGNHSLKAPDLPQGTTLSDIVGNTAVSSTKDPETKVQTLKYSTLPGWGLCTINVTKYDESKPYFEMDLVLSHDTALCFSFDGNIDWGLGHHVYKKGAQKLVFDISGYELSEDFAISFYTDAQLEGPLTEEKTITVNTYRFKALTSMSEIAGNDKVSVSKDEETVVQTLKYSTLPGWNTCDIKVQNYDSSLKYFEFEADFSESATLCFSFNGKYEGHFAYNGAKQIICLDVSTYNLPENFTIQIYTDATAGSISKEKVINVYSYGFKEVPSPQGFSISIPSATAMNISDNENGGWVISWTNDGSAYRKIAFKINNHTTEDILKIDLEALQGRCLGIVVNFSDGDDVTVRNHWSTNQKVAVFQKTGKEVIIINLHAFEEAEAKVITSVNLYFDPPTLTYEYDMENEAHMKINSFELLKSEELSLEDLVVSAEDMSVEYSNEDKEFEYEVNKEVNVFVEYRKIVGVDEEENSFGYTLPKKIGEYEVRITYYGSLEYNYFIKEYKLTITKGSQVAKTSLVTFNKETGVYSFEEGVIVATQADFSSGSLLTSGQAVNKDTTVYIKLAENDNYKESPAVSLLLDFTEPTYSLTFNANGHGTAPGKVDGLLTVPVLFPLSLEGYRFHGWFSDEDCTEEVLEGGVLTKDLTLYAKWEKLETPTTAPTTAPTQAPTEAPTNAPTVPTNKEPDKKAGCFGTATGSLIPMLLIISAMFVAVSLIGRKKKYTNQ